MKQRFQHIILLIILALAWSGEVWGYSSTKLNVSVSGGGLVAITSSTSAPAASAYQSSASLEQGRHGFFETQVTDYYYIWVKPNSGFQAVSMSGDFSSSETKASGQYYAVSFKGRTFVDDATKSVTITFKTTYNFSATATPNGSSYGTASASVSPTSVANTTSTSASSTATFTATPKTGYEFQGWGTTSTATSYESTENPYKPTINGIAGSTANKTLYAIFKPYFNFTVTANKINGSYGTVTQSVTSKVIGNPSDNSASTQATFTATPNANCTFEGWYEDAEHTKPASADNSYKNQTFKPTIINTSIGSTKTLTLYAYFKANQTLTWTHPDIVNIVNEVTTEGAAAATAKSAVTGTATELAVTYSSSNANVASVNATTGDVTGVSVPTAPGNIVTITARQAGNAEFNPVEATRQFTVINKYRAMYSPSFTVTADAATLYVGDTETITCTDTGEGFKYDSTDPTVVSISESNGVITLNALKVGTSTITLTQPPTTTHYAASAIYNITVTKVPNNLKFSLAATEALVDGTIAVTFTDQNNTGTPIVGAITEQTLSSGVNQSVNNETPVITYANGVITARNAGTAKITFSQAETAKYAGKTSSTYTITVSKYSNNIIATVTRNNVSSTDLKLKYGETATLSYTYENKTSTPTVSRHSGSYTTLSGSTITAGNTQGNDVYEIIQAETYKYEAGYASFTIRVNNTDEATGYVLYDDEEHGWSTISSYTTATLSGPADVLSYDAYKWWGGYNYFYVMTSTNNGSSWEQYDNPDLPTSYKHYPDNKLKENVNRIKFETRLGATSEKRVKNILVTRKTYVKESHDTTKDNLGTVLTGNTATSATITVSYSSTNGGNISIQSDNDNFVPSISTISVESNKKATSPGGTQYICGVDGTQTFTVTYTPDPKDLLTKDLNPETAVITIRDLFYTQTITLTATAAKRANTLAIIDDQSVKVDDVISNVYSSKNSDATITPTIENIEGENVISYNLSTNEITAVGAGTARLTLTQPATDSHYGATKSVTVTVSKYNQTVNWNNDLDDEARTLEVGVSPVLTTNKATASSGLDVTYSSSNPAALAVDATTGDLTALSGPATVTITATQAGNYKYKSASITRTFTIIQKEEVTITTTLSESGTNFFPIGSDDITIRPSAPVTVSALVITGDEGTLTSTFASNTFTLHAVKEGTVTLTLTRDADDGYYALSKTYTIQVIKPVLVLDPTETPVIEYEDYSRVTLSRTLPAGYSSLALPFSTTITTLTGRAANANDWVAQLETVTYSQADGYTLHFNKVMSGDITANQPYILHLGTEVVNPVWTNVTLSAATATEITASAGYGDNVGAIGIYSDWSMTSNFTVGTSMNGKYGVVNSAGGLKKGGSSATLNAFSAYITPPTGSAGIKVRSAFTDEFGTNTYISGLPDETTGFDNGCLYDLSGRKVSARTVPARGIYLNQGRRILIK